MRRPEEGRRAGRASDCERRVRRRQIDRGGKKREGQLEEGMRGRRGWGDWKGWGRGALGRGGARKRRTGGKGGKGGEEREVGGRRESGEKEGSREGGDCGRRGGAQV